MYFFSVPKPLGLVQSTSISTFHITKWSKELRQPGIWSKYRRRQCPLQCWSCIPRNNHISCNCDLMRSQTKQHEAGVRWRKGCLGIFKGYWKWHPLFCSSFSSAGYMTQGKRLPSSASVCWSSWDYLFHITWRITMRTILPQLLLFYPRGCQDPLLSLTRLSWTVLCPTSSWVSAEKVFAQQSVHPSVQKGM